MTNLKVEIGKTYRHFKGTLYKIIALAKHSETLEDMVIYTHEEAGQVWARPYNSFISFVDKEKYPEIIQKYRFELVEEND